MGPSTFTCMVQALYCISIFGKYKYSYWYKYNHCSDNSNLNVHVYSSTFGSTYDIDISLA